MSNADAPAKAWRRRRYYLIDRPTQVSVTLHVVGVLAGIGALYALAVHFLFASNVMDGMSPERVRQFLLLVHIAYFSLGAAIMALTVLILTHRFVGPAMVMRRALAGMRAGDFGRRLSLRRRDYLKPLAEELNALRTEIATREVVQARLLCGLERSLDATELDTARAFLRELQGAPEDEDAESAGTEVPEPAAVGA